MLRALDGAGLTATTLRTIPATVRVAERARDDIRAHRRPQVFRASRPLEHALPTDRARVDSSCPLRARWHGGRGSTAVSSWTWPPTGQRRPRQVTAVRLPAVSTLPKPCAEVVERVSVPGTSTALNKHKGLQQFFKWLLVDEQAIDRSPMERVRQPKTPRKLIPVLRDEDTGKLLDACKGKGFVNLRDEALIRLYCNTGARLSEVGNLLVADVDLNTESVHFHGKGARTGGYGSDPRLLGR